MAASVAMDTGMSPRTDVFRCDGGRRLLTVEGQDGFRVQLHARDAAEWQALRAALLAAIEEPAA